MEIKQGYSYHIKEEFFNLIQDKYLMSNKENGNYRPHFYAVQDKKNPALYCLFPISSQVEKYKEIVEKKEEKIKPITVHKELNRILTENLREVLAMNDRGIKLIFTDIARIKAVMEKEANK